MVKVIIKNQQHKNIDAHRRSCTCLSCESSLRYCSATLQRASEVIFSKQEDSASRMEQLTVDLSWPSKGLFCLGNSSRSRTPPTRHHHLPLDVIASHEAIGTHLLHIFQRRKHFLYRVCLSHSNFGFGQGAQILHLPPIILLISHWNYSLRPLLWTFSALKIKQFLPGMNGVSGRMPQAVLLQATLTCLASNYT